MVQYNFSNLQHCNYLPMHNILVWMSESHLGSIVIGNNTDRVLSVGIY